MNKVLLLSAVVLVVAVSNADVLVQWGETGPDGNTQGATDIVTANVNYVGRSSTYDGGEDNPVVGSNYYLNNAGRNAVFASAASAGFKQALVAQASSGDRLTQYDTIASGLTFRNMIMWESTNFLVNSAGYTVTNVTININARDVSNIEAGVRVIVQQGSSFYVTDAQSFNNTFSQLIFNLSVATWYDFTPFVSGVEAIGSIASVSLTDIDGIGFYTTVKNGDAVLSKGTGSQVSYFQLTGSTSGGGGPIDPPPASVVSIDSAGAGQDVINWTTAQGSGYVYSVWYSTNLLNGFQPLVTNLTDTVQSWTNTVDASPVFYQIKAQ